ncbi:ECF transporter S component, partial [Micromonospora luteifusca]
MSRASTTDTSRWRTIDIVVASVIAVAFGVIFWAWVPQRELLSDEQAVA